MLSRDAPAPLVIPAIFWLAGLVAGYFFGAGIVFFLILFLIIFAAFFILKSNYMLLLLLISVSGMLRMKISNIHPPNHLSNLLESAIPVKVNIEGKIKSVERETKFRNTYLCELSKLNGSICRGTICFHSRTKLQCGDLIKSRMTLEKPEGPRNPGEKDWRLYWYVRGIYGFGNANENIEITSSDPDLPERFRNKVQELLRTRLGTYSGYAEAMLLGQTEKINYEYRQALRRSGLSHLFAVSGLHVGLISLVMYSVFRIFIRRRSSHNLVLLFLIFYGFICNWIPSVSRALVMYLLYRGSMMLERPVNINQILALSIILITAVCPQQAFSTGLQLSAAATLVIVNLLPVLEKIRTGRKAAGTFLKSTLITLALTTGVVIFLMPITISTFGSFSFNAIIGIVPASLLFSLLLPLLFPILLLPWVWQPFTAAYGFLMDVFNRLLYFTAELPFFSSEPNLDFIHVLFLYTGTAVIFLIRKRNRKVIIIPLLILVITVFIFPFYKDDPAKGKMRITCLDCGQGDMTLVETANGEKVLIDTGPPPVTEHSGKCCLLPWLQKRRIKALDYLIVSHAHNDHYGGFPEVFGGLEIKCLIYGDTFWEDIEEKELFSLIEQENCRLLYVQDNFSLYLGETEVKFMHPGRNYPENNVNNNSLVLMIKYREFSALFTGDIELAAENELVFKYGKELKADFLKVPHHGSLSSSTPAFVECVSAGLCFIPAGKNNRFGFPDRLVRERYRERGTRVIVGAESGAMILETEGFSYTYRVMLK